MTVGPEHPSAIGAELARLRKLEQGLRTERDRIRAAAAEEVLQLQTALREASARAAQREREVQRLAGELQKAGGRPPRLRRGGLQDGRLRWGRAGRDDASALERVLATFERERQKLEERARAVAQTETRQRAAEAAFGAEAERLAKAAESLEERRRVASELESAGKRIGKLERQLQEHTETKAALQGARAELAELDRVSRDRREAEVALLAARTRLSEAADEAEGERDVQDRIAVMLARREAELERRAAGELDRRRDELERETAAEWARLRAGGAERVIRERADLREEISARETDLARREEEVTRREIQLSLVRRRIGEEERRLQERTWRTDAPQQPARPPVVAHRPRDLTFSEGWRLLAGRHGRGPGDEVSGSW